MFFTACARGGFSCPRPQLRRAVPCGALCLQLRAVAARSAGAWVFLWWGAAPVGAQCGGEEIRRGQSLPHQTHQTRQFISSLTKQCLGWESVRELVGCVFEIASRC